MFNIFLRSATKVLIRDDTEILIAKSKEQDYAIDCKKPISFIAFTSRRGFTTGTYLHRSTSLASVALVWMSLFWSAVTSKIISVRFPEVLYIGQSGVISEASTCLFGSCEIAKLRKDFANDETKEGSLTTGGSLKLNHTDVVGEDRRDISADNHVTYPGILKPVK